MTVLPPDPYKILGVPKDAQILEIRAAYRKLVLKCHPDKIQDPALKQEKQIEFQKVQEAYELLNNEVEREKYDRRAEYELVRERERERARTSAARATSSTPKRDPVFYHVKEASPRTSTFAKSSPYGRTPPQSWEGTATDPRLFEEAIRHARKAASYEKEKPSKRDEERRRRKEDEEWAREREKAREREAREVRDARKAKERREEKERAARDRDEREKEKRKEEKKKAHSDREKEREKERKSATAEKHRTRQHPIIEESSSDAPDSSDDDVVYEPAPKADRKKSSSGRRPEDVDPPSTTERTRKLSGNMETAIRYLNRSGAKPPGFGRSHTYTEGSSSMMYTTPMVPTPPPATTPFVPPPPVNEPEEMSEEDVARRSSARPSTRRMSHDNPRSSREKTSSHKKSTSSRDQPIIVEAGSPRAIPSFSRAHTESYARPIPVPGLGRSETWYATTEREHERRERSRSRVTPPAYSDDDDSENDRERRHRRSRRTQSPEAMPHTRYTVDGSGTKSIPIRPKQYHEQPSRGAYKTSKAYVMPNSSARVQRGHKSYARDYGHYEEEPSHHFSEIKYSQQFGERDIRYSDLPYKGSYRSDIYA
ncbi:hypothetical protein F5Y09DRAFT_235533 [Xylaria sp. FL1042]|nr:hypothetical protein F5Y09DRAFT_235533 [Xylaria sp. FL1042]